MLKRYLLVCALSFGLLQAVAAQAVEDEDFGLMTSERIGPFRIGMPDDEVLKATNCVFKRGKMVDDWITGGYVSDWDSEGCGITLGMGSDTPNGVQRIGRIILSDTGKFKTARGVGIGSTEKEVIRLYKKEQEKNQSAAGKLFVAGTIYGGMIFKFTANKVIGIFLGAAAE